MTPEKNIIDDLLNYRLSEEILDNISLDEETLHEIDKVELSDKLSKEFFRPGYDTFMTGKKEEFRNLIKNDSQVENNAASANRNISQRNIFITLLGFLLVGGILYLVLNSSKEQKITIEEVRRYAMLSYESTGALHANRGSGQSPNELSVNYDLLQNEKCSELVLSGKYPEQELWSQLYCAYLNNDIEKIDFYKSQIIEKKYANYTKL